MWLPDACLGAVFSAWAAARSYGVSSIVVIALVLSYTFVMGYFCVPRVYGVLRQTVISRRVRPRNSILGEPGGRREKSHRPTIYRHYPNPM